MKRKYGFNVKTVRAIAFIEYVMLIFLCVHGVAYKHIAFDHCYNMICFTVRHSFTVLLKQCGSAVIDATVLKPPKGVWSRDHTKNQGPHSLRSTSISNAIGYQDEFILL